MGQSNRSARNVTTDMYTTIALIVSLTAIVNAQTCTENAKFEADRRNYDHVIARLCNSVDDSIDANTDRLCNAMTTSGELVHCYTKPAQENDFQSESCRHGYEVLKQANADENYCKKENGCP